MGNKSLRYAALVAFVLALGFWANSGNALPPQAGGGPAPGKLPDILGITTGMPAQQALDLVRAHDAGHTAGYVRMTIPQLYGDRPIMSSMNMATTSGSIEDFVVTLTPPPLEQRVYAVHRSLHVMAQKAALINELVQKYGTTTWDPRPNPQPPQAGGPLTWLFDETGQPVIPANQADRLKMRDCLSLTGQPWNTGQPASNTRRDDAVPGNPRGSVAQPNPAFDPAVHHVCDNVVVVSASLSGSDPNWVMIVDILDWTLQHRAAKVWNDALNAVVQKGAQQQQNNASQQALPKF
jgi:hypothetical protein